MGIRVRVKKEPPARGNGERNDIHLRKKRIQERHIYGERR